MERRGITELRYFSLPGFAEDFRHSQLLHYEAVAPEEAGLAYLFVNYRYSLVRLLIALKSARKVHQGACMNTLPHHSWVQHIGAPARLLVDQYFRKFTDKPVGTFIVNVAGLIPNRFDL